MCVCVTTEWWGTLWLAPICFQMLEEQNKRQRWQEDRHGRIKIHTHVKIQFETVQTYFSVKLSNYKKTKTIERNREAHLGQRRLRRNECVAEKEGPGIEEEKWKKKRKSKDRQSCKALWNTVWALDWQSLQTSTLQMTGYTSKKAPIQTLAQTSGTVSRTLDSLC